MRVGIVEVKKLVTVRETFRPMWRFGVGLFFLIFACLWLGAIYQPNGFQGLVMDENVRPYTLALASFITLSFAVIFFRTGVLARTLFLLAAVFVSFHLFFFAAAILVWTSKEAHIVFPIAGALFTLLLWWDILARRMYALGQSLIPIGRWRVYRQQVTNSLRLWAGQWKGADARPGARAGGGRTRGRRAHLNLTLAVAAFAVGLLGALFFFVGTINRDFVLAIYGGEFSRAWDILLHLEIQPPGPWSDFPYIMSFLLFGFLSFVLFGYSWSRWKRGGIQTYRTPLSEHMTPSSVLLLRSFDDDIKYVPGKPQSLLSTSFRAYEWGYTFEQLIQGRLACVGELRSLAWGTKKDSENEGAGNDKNAAPARDTFWDKVKKFAKKISAKVERVVKIYDLPPAGAIRHEASEAEWRAEIKKSIPVARMIVVLLGVTTSLQWEIDQIKGRGFFGKTVFLMPPLTRSESRRQRWEEFVTRYLFETEACKAELLKQVDPKHILAVCFHANDLVLITGALNQLSYESALDVATVLTLAPASQSGEMITRHIDIAARLPLLRLSGASVCRLHSRDSQPDA